MGLLGKVEHSTPEQLFQKATAPANTRLLPQKRDWKEGEVDQRGKRYQAIPGKRHFHLWELEKVDGEDVTMRCVACPDVVVLRM